MISIVHTLVMVYYSLLFVTPKWPLAGRPPGTSPPKKRIGHALYFVKNTSSGAPQPLILSGGTRKGLKGNYRASCEGIFIFVRPKFSYITTPMPLQGRKLNALVLPVQNGPMNQNRLTKLIIPSRPNFATVCNY